MFTDLRRESRRIVASAAAIVALGSLAACNNAEPDDGTGTAAAPACERSGFWIFKKEWKPVPTNFKASAIAQITGSTEDEVRNGTFGEAVCDPALPAAQTSGTIIRIAGVSDHCMSIGVYNTSGPPQAGQSYENILAVCPKDAE